MLSRPMKVQTKVSCREGPVLPRGRQVAQSALRLCKKGRNRRLEQDRGPSRFSRAGMGRQTRD